MQFTSPLFIFIFLPLMMAALALTPARYRRWTILISGVLFYVLANIKTPVSILFLAVSATFAYCASYAVYVSRKKPKRTMMFFCVAVCVTMFAALRFCGVWLEAYDITFLPLGVSVYLLSVISMTIDISRGDAEPPANFADALLYIGFFPVLIAGPIIKYKDFVRITSEEKMEFSLNNAANGIVLFAGGFVKRIGVAAIMADAYDRIIDNIPSGGELKLGVGLFLVLLMLANVYYAFSGYSDMGRGMALIMGIHLEPDFHYPFAACTPTEYLKRFLGSLYSFLDDYFAGPLENLLNGIASKKGKRPRAKAVAFLAGATIALLNAMWFKASLPMLVAFLPLTLLVAAERADLCGKTGESWIRRNLFTRSCGRFVTIILVSLFWTQLKLRSVGQMIEYFTSLTVRGSYQSYRLYLTLFNTEYLWVFAAALLLALPAILDGCGFDWSRGRAGAVIRTVYCGGLLLFFVFSIIVIMPQYPEYAAEPLKYITF